ncbi:hypothetical protein [Ktedonobacter racemifer]|uniref:Uncharacterized protein n=1 Tax=Ktedonobacter racemifer DSM 44963 TaxID=485913 RepID=D6TLE7_KTERA|nr:hypothetical protein [Ktedonobacter racemifer]EFH86597.1 hypothetical protein Krac_7900 [Ktedonobacter racemifer DSM 44963]
MPELHPIVYEVLTYMDHQRSKDSRTAETTKYDSRFIFQGVKPHVHKTHDEWIAFLKEVQNFKLALKKIKMLSKFKFLFNDIEWDKYDLRATSLQEEFAMLPPMHVSLLLCFDAISIP